MQLVNVRWRGRILAEESPCMASGNIHNVQSFRKGNQTEEVNRCAKVEGFCGETAMAVYLSLFGSPACDLDWVSSYIEVQPSLF